MAVISQILEFVRMNLILNKAQYRINVYLIFIAVALTIRCGGSRVEPEPTMKAPSGNYVDISGTIPDSTRLEINLVYSTTNDECRRTINWLEGVSTEETYLKIIPLTKALGKYHAVAALDIPHEGKCGWILSHILFRFREGDQIMDDALFFSEKSKQKIFTINKVCNLQKYDDQTTFYQCQVDNIPDLSLVVKKLIVNFSKDQL